MSNSTPIKFTLLTACKDEEKDIHLAIESALAQTYPHKEILFVDDSTDKTKEIIRNYHDQGIKLLDGRGVGCCQARNLGMQNATGDVIVFLTADTKLKPDYLEKIVGYYEEGYDWVTVQSFSYNIESIYSLFVEMQHRYWERQSGFAPLTTAGYSVRRKAAEEVGFISGGDYPVNTCRDWSLGKKLEEKNYKKKYDRSISVPHKSPDNFAEFWLVQRTRGLMSAYQPYFMFKQSPHFLALKFLTKDIMAVFHFLLILPAAIRVGGMARHSERPFSNYIPLFFTYLISVSARCAGEWQGLIKIFRLRRQGW